MSGLVEVATDCGQALAQPGVEGVPVIVAEGFAGEGAGKSYRKFVKVYS